MQYKDYAIKTDNPVSVSCFIYDEDYEKDMIEMSPESYEDELGITFDVDDYEGF